MCPYAGSTEVPGSTKAVGSFVLCTPGWRMIIRLNVTNGTTNTTCSNNSNEAATAAAKICLVYLAELILPHPKALEFTHTETQQKKKKNLTETETRRIASFLPSGHGAAPRATRCAPVTSPIVSLHPCDPQTAPRLPRGVRDGGHEGGGREGERDGVQGRAADFVHFAATSCSLCRYLLVHFASSQQTLDSFFFFFSQIPWSRRERARRSLWGRDPPEAVLI